MEQNTTTNTDETQLQIGKKHNCKYRKNIIANKDKQPKNKDETHPQIQTKLQLRTKHNCKYGQAQLKNKEKYDCKHETQPQKTYLQVEIIEKSLVSVIVS